jgi:hypothetical protein
LGGITNNFPRASNGSITRSSASKALSASNVSAAISKGQLCDLAREKTGATGEHTGGRLRELSEEGVLEVQIRKGHAHYRLAEKVPTLFLKA